MSERRASSSKGPALVDQEARDRIAHDLDTTLVVEAAAGTGKTTALVERVLSLLRSGKATLESLVAVTFTEKAAGEMKLRLRTEIEAARSSCASGDERARLDQALEHLEAAHIGTIHAFCADLLRARPVEARIDPLFEVVSEDDAQRLVDEAFTAWFQKTLASPGEGVSRVLRRITAPDVHKAFEAAQEGDDENTPLFNPNEPQRPRVPTPWQTPSVTDPTNVR